MSVLLGPADADHYRVKVGRFGDRFYTDPLPACDLAGADDDTYPSISTVKKASGQDWSYVAMKRVAKALTAKPDRFVGMDTFTEVYDRIKSIDKVDKEAAFARGTAVHLYAEDRLRGVAEPRRDIAGGDYFDAVDRFFDDYQPELVAAEVVAINRTLNGAGYGGTLDALVRITLEGMIQMRDAERAFIIDWKSRGEGSDHGAYPEEAAQLGGYSFADYIIVEGPNGPERRQLPELAGGLIISIKSDGYRVYPIDLPAAQEHWSALHSWWVARRNERDAVGRPWAPHKSSPGGDIPALSGDAETTGTTVTRPAPTTPPRTARRGGKDSLADASNRASAQHRAAAPAASSRGVAESPRATAADIDDEGGPADDAAIAELGRQFKALDDKRRAWIDTVVVEAREAEAPITLHGARTLRRYHIARGLIAWAVTDWSYNEIRDMTVGLLGEVIYERRPLGAVVGSLDHELAADWADLAVAAELADRTA